MVEIGFLPLAAPTARHKSRFEIETADLIAAIEVAAVEQAHGRVCDPVSGGRGRTGDLKDSSDQNRRLNSSRMIFPVGKAELGPVEGF
jgi:hypothetical protein